MKPIASRLFGKETRKAVVYVLGGVTLVGICLMAWFYITESSPKGEVKIAISNNSRSVMPTEFNLDINIDIENNTNNNINFEYKESNDPEVKYISIERRPFGGRGSIPTRYRLEVRPKAEGEEDSSWAFSTPRGG